MTENFLNSGWKVNGKVTFRKFQPKIEEYVLRYGSPFIPVGTNPTECCLPSTNFSVPSRFQTHATQIRPFLDSNHNRSGISTVNWQIAYHYACNTPTSFFCQMVTTQGFYQGCLTFRDSYVQEFLGGALTSSVLTAMGSYLLVSYL